LTQKEILKTLKDYREGERERDRGNSKKWKYKKKVMSKELSELRDVKIL
jgi:cytochrome c553